MIIPLSEVINTNRCSLRIVSEADIPHIWSATRVEGFNKGMVWDPPRHIDELREPLERNLKAWQEGSAYNWTIEHNKTKKFIGPVEIRFEQSSKVWSIGFWTHPKHQGNGYATECVSSIISFGFVRLKAKAIRSAHAKWNITSTRVMEKLGMKLTGENPCGFRKKGECVEEFEYELTRDDWAAQN